VAREQAAEDDAALERLHQAAAQGELRSKKRDRGIGLNGSDSEDSGDEEENRRLRRTLAKKRKLRGGDGLEALGEIPHSTSTKPILTRSNFRWT